MTVIDEGFTLDVAPACCIVCARPFDDQPEGGFSHLEGAKPIGAMSCVGQCTAAAIARVRERGRADLR